MKTPMRVLRKSSAVALSALLLDPFALGARCVQAAELKGLEVQPDALTLQGDEPLRYNTFLTANPPRLVVELLDTTARVKQKSFTGAGRFMGRVRAGQYATKPKPVSRVVVDLNQPVPYEVEERGNDLVVRLEAVKTDTVVLKDVPAAAGALRLAQTPEALSESMPAEPEMQAAPAPAAARPAEAAAPAPAQARRVGDILDSLSAEPEDFHIDAMDIRDVLRLLSEQAQINVVYGPDVSGSLTLHLSAVAFRDIFRTVLNMQGLVTEQVGDKILRVMTPTVYQAARQVAVPQTKVFQLNYAKAADIRTHLDSIRSTEGRRGSTGVDDKTNSIIVTDSPEGLDQAARLIAQLDRRPKQVLIEAKLVEVEFTKTAELGIRWSAAYVDQGSKIGNQIGTNYLGMANTADTINDLAGTALGKAPQSSAEAHGAGVRAPISVAPVGAIGFGRLSQHYNLDAQIQAAASKGKAKILSDPKVATLNNQRAVIQITTQLPYVTSTLTSTGVSQQSVQFLTTGITLTVTPTINADGHITLAIVPEVSRPGVREPITGARGANSRKTETTVLVKDGETIVIGGLISDSVSDSVSKVPLLGDIPILGWLFKSKASDRSRQELLVFVTTRLMGN